MFDWNNANTLLRDQKIWGDFEKSPSQNPPLNVQSSSPVAVCLLCSNHFGVHQSLSFFPLKGFLNSLCLFSSTSFCFAASSSSPFSNALMSGLSLQSVGARSPPLPASLSFMVKEEKL